ncbi:hypothetical protein ABZZ46_15805 [Streptomyces rochei]
MLGLRSWTTVGEDGQVGEEREERAVEGEASAEAVLADASSELVL